MISVMQVTHGTDRLVLSYPLAVGVGLLLVATALAVGALVRRPRGRGQWALPTAAVVAAWAGLYFATFNVTITNETGSVYAFMRYDQDVRWKDAADIYLERRGGEDWHIVVLDKKRRAFDFSVADLPLEERDRVMAYMVDRMPPDAFTAAAPLLKREAAEGMRQIGLFADQQI